jgi:hypothetical protein
VLVKLQYLNSKGVLTLSHMQKKKHVVRYADAKPVQMPTFDEYCLNLKKVFLVEKRTIVPNPFKEV